ncbi:uncharacterized protein I206_104804 [Kwoniella pini CBS 10737]|uniref:Histone-lysine N-methyltransferase, H3 lysine-4 specific n=1 Tax=Kwoniella pini CBS 10737 TaxID=1296096 RepID=A0A1B9I7U9_9TREE|nr:uncharacterized protein I206_02343 [Kwoniella pini CBS 10737]OCF51628.1 hypothetical protein I206_02343 [Kwoniella pini CBS 10737]
MAPSPSPSARPPPTGPRIPPTGPKALRNVNGGPPSAPAKQPPAGPSALLNGKHDKISFAFPQRATALPEPSSQAGPSRSKINSLNIPTSTGSPSSTLTDVAKVINLNGIDESGKSVKSNSTSSLTPFRINIPSGPSPNRSVGLKNFPSTTSIASTSTSSSSKLPLKTEQQDSRRIPTSPKKRHSKKLSSDTGKSEEDTSYRANFLPTDGTSRAKVSISFVGLPIGATASSSFLKRPQPPHLANLPFERSSPNGSPPPLPPSSPPPPPQNGSRPLTPPLPPDDNRPPTPPPPPEYEDGLPPPPPSPPTQAPSPLPPPPPLAPKSFYNSASSSRPHSSPIPLPPSSSRPPSPPPIEPPSPPPPAPPSPGPPALEPTAPPSFHFRDLSMRRLKSPSEDAEHEDQDVDMESGQAPQTPPSPPTSPTPPYIPPPYIPPACVKPRPGLGNFLVVGKEKRLDGMLYDQPVEVFDPRLKLTKEQLHKGRGVMKNRAGFYEVEYEWDEYSTGPKPPPPPAAVLITGLSPLTTTDQISKFLRPYGRIKDIDAKMDNKSGMQLGICWVKFDGPPHGKKGTAHEVACQVVKACDAQRISLNTNEKIKVVLDGRGFRTKKAVEEEMLRRYPPPKPKVLPKPPTPALIPPTIAGTSTPSSAGAQTPRAGADSSISSRPLPTIPKPSSGSLPTRPAFRPPTAPANFHTSLPSRPGALPSRPTTSSTYLPSPSSHLSNRPTGLPSRPNAPVQHLASSFTAAPFSRHASDSYDYNDRGGKRYDTANSYTPLSRRPISRSRSRTPYSDYSSDYTSDSEDDIRPTYRSREKSPYGRRRAPPQPSKVDEQAVEKMKAALASNGLAHVFIDSKFLPSTENYSNYVKDHFKMFKPAQILHNHIGWYILFSDNFSAYRAQRVLDTTAIQGHKMTLVVKTPPSARKLDEDRSTATAGDVEVDKGSGGTWKYLTITKKNRPAPKTIDIPTGPKADRTKADTLRRKIIDSDQSSDEEDIPIVKAKKRLPSFSSASSLSDDELVPSKTTKDNMAMDIDEIAEPAKETIKAVVQEHKEETPIAKGKKRPGKAVKVTKKSKKARLDSPVPTVEIPPPAEPEVAEITIDKPAEIEEVIKETKKVVSGKKKGPKSEFDKFIGSAVLDEEDAYWLGKALESAKTGIEPDFPSAEAEKDEGLLDEDHPLYHKAGSWRAEGFKKIPSLAKSSYLPQRNKATKAASTSDDAVMNAGVTTGRTARLAGRDQNRQVTTSTITDSELFAFNQLRIRKKQLRFARSAIEGYGLYAMETIVKGEMVCEYVGELCRAAIADVREQKYLKQGIGSSYLFRIDNDIVCDATFRGSVSRLINHSCDPSANAKIIKVNGQSKIVIYAERTLHPGEEILYDYKFPLESDPSLRVPCLCGAATCRGWLN